MARTRESTERNQLEIERRAYRITGITPILGGQPANPAVREAYIASKAPTDELRDEETALDYGSNDTGVTVFCRNKDDQLCMMAHQVKGYFKEALTAIKQQSQVANVRGKVGTLMFVAPRFIPILRDGAPLREEDEMLERPLRAQTMQGPRVTLASSEMLLDPWSVEFEIARIPNAGTAKSKAPSWDEIELALSYGEYHGFCQWRNAGYGSFRWERIK